MNPYVRDRIARKLDTLSDERLYQVLDYVEFLETKYAEKAASPVNVFQRFAEGVEDKLRAGGLAVSTVSETMGFLNKAMGVLNGVAQTTVAVGRDVVSAAKSAADQVGAPDAAGVPSAPSAPAPGATGGTQPAPTTSPTSGPGMSSGTVTPPEAAA
ncbi:MAG TPA: hypothetical protein VE869_16600 [Gemmatimonas sp.]|nr:hypothetical protein [Gemmatimonas sp.]